MGIGHGKKAARNVDAWLQGAYHVREPERDGEILEVLGDGVRWTADGHVSKFFPAPTRASSTSGAGHEPDLKDERLSAIAGDRMETAGPG